MGYEGEEGETRTKLALYIYCDSEDGQKEVAKRLRSKFASRAKIFQVTPEERDKKYFNVAVRTDSNLLQSDVTWFVTIFEAFGLTLIP